MVPEAGDSRKLASNSRKLNLADFDSVLVVCDAIFGIFKTKS